MKNKQARKLDPPSIDPNQPTIFAMGNQVETMETVDW